VGARENHRNPIVSSAFLIMMKILPGCGENDKVPGRVDMATGSSQRVEEVGGAIPSTPKF
jgi:hypothetical protein